MLRACLLACLAAAPVAAADPVVRVALPGPPPDPPKPAWVKLLAVTPAGQAVALDKGGMVWVDLATGKDAARWPGATGKGIGNLVVDASGAWALRERERSDRWELVDLAKRRVAATFLLPRLYVQALTVANGTAYVQASAGATYKASLYAFDPATGRTRWQTESSADTGRGFTLAADRGPDGLTWVTRTDPERGNALLGVDPATGAVKATVPLPESAVAFQSDGLSARLLGDNKTAVLPGKAVWVLVDLSARTVRTVPRSATSKVSAWDARPDGKAAAVFDWGESSGLVADALPAGTPAGLFRFESFTSYDSVRYAPDGKTLLLTRNWPASWRVDRLDLAANKLTTLASRGEDPGPPAAPDRSVSGALFAGERAVVTLDRAGHVQRVDATNGHVSGADWPAIPGDAGGYAIGPASPTGNTLVARRGDAVSLLDLRTGKFVPLELPPGSSDPGEARFTPDAAAVVVRTTGLERRTVLAVYDVATGARRHVVSTADEGGRLVALADGAPAFLARRALPRPLDTAAGKLGAPVGRWADSYGMLDAQDEFAPDGRTFVSYRGSKLGERALYGVAVRSSGGGSNLDIPGGPGYAIYTPDGRYVVDSVSGAAVDVTLVRAAGKLPPGLEGFSPSGKLCVTLDSSELRVYETAPFFTPPRGAPLDPAKARAAWRNALGRSGPEWRTLARPLFADPAGAVAAARAVVKPAVPLDPAAVTKQFAALGADKLADRERAYAALGRYGVVLKPHGEAFRKTAPSAEARRLAAPVLEDLDDDRPRNPTDLAALQAVELLERLGDPARALLAELAAGDPAAVLTEEAKAAVLRLGRR